MGVRREIAKKCCGVAPLSKKINNDTAAYLYCPVCGRKSLPFAVEKVNGEYIAEQHALFVAQLWNEEVANG